MCRVGSSSQRGVGRQNLASTTIVIALSVVIGASACGRVANVATVIPATSPSVSSSPYASPTPSILPSSSPCASAPAPSVRVGAAGAFDAHRGEMVVFGGDVQKPPSMGSAADTWIRGSGCWIKPNPAVSPPDRAYAAMAYDPGSQKVLLFGGQRDAPGSSPAYLNDTWSWDGATWTQLAGSGPAVWGAVGAFDTARGEFIVFGVPLTGPPAQTWAWRGGQWVRLQPLSSPPARADEAVAYDVATQRVVLFGGARGGAEPLNDTWTWDGANWKREQPLHSPSPRYGAAMCASGATTLLFGGSHEEADFSLWNGSDWRSVGAPTMPPGRHDAVCVSDPSGYALLFGGQGVTGQIYNDLWSWDGAQWTSR